MVNDAYLKLQKTIKVTFKDKNLLKQALIHRSYLNECKDLGLGSNERLEFLGDAILSFWVSREVYRRFPDNPEGKLTFIRTHLVRTETLASLGLKLHLGDFLFMSRGEEMDKGRENTLLLANTFEALAGAIYLDQGFAAIEKYFTNLFDSILNSIDDAETLKDCKSRLQEKLQTKGSQPPQYRLLSQEGPDHQRTFTMGVYFDDILLSQGTGRSKQEAEEAAAKMALENLAKLT